MKIKNLRIDAHPLNHTRLGEWVQQLRQVDEPFVKRIAAVPPVLGVAKELAGPDEWAGIVPLVARRELGLNRGLDEDVTKVADRDKSTMVVVSLARVADAVRKKGPAGGAHGVIDFLLFGDYLRDEIGMAGHGWPDARILEHWNALEVRVDKSFFSYRRKICAAIIHQGVDPEGYYGKAVSTAYKEVRKALEKEGDSASQQAMPPSPVANDRIRWQLEHQIHRLELAAARIERADWGRPPSTAPSTESGHENGGRIREVPVRHLLGRPQEMIYPVERGEFRAVTVRYGLVDLDHLVASHNPKSGFAPSPPDAFPTGVQERAYHLRPLAQEAVRHAAGNLKPELLLDTTCLATAGPPTVTCEWPNGPSPSRSRFWAISGNQRVMMLKLAKFSAREIVLEDGTRLGSKYDQYKDELVMRAADFGFSDSDVRLFRTPVLVRVLDDQERRNASHERATLSPISTQLTQLAQATNVSLVKSHSPIEASVPIARKLLAQPEILATLAHFDSTRTLRENLRHAKGREFARKLRLVVPESEYAEVFHAMPEDGASAQAPLTGWGRLLVENALWLACFDGVLCKAPPLTDADEDLDALQLVDNLSEDLRRKLLRSVPLIVRANAHRDEHRRLARYYFHAVAAILSSRQKDLLVYSPDRVIWLQRFLREVSERQRTDCLTLYLEGSTDLDQAALFDEGDRLLGPSRFSDYASLPPLGLDLAARAAKIALERIAQEDPGLLPMETPSVGDFRLPDGADSVKRSELNPQRRALLNLAKSAEVHAPLRDALLRPDTWDAAFHEVTGTPGSARALLVAKRPGEPNMNACQEALIALFGEALPLNQTLNTVQSAGALLGYFGAGQCD